MKKKHLKILYISQYYPPEIGATQTRAFEMARNLVNRGHQVTVLTEFPNHPTGIIPKQYRFKFFKREHDSGIDILRMWVFARPKKNFLTRIIFYFSFMFTAIIGGLAIRKKYDVVYATSPPLFVAGAGYVISFLRGIKFVMEVRDLWPESAVVLGELSNKFFIRLSEKYEKFLYTKAVKIVTVTQGIYDRLIQMDIQEVKLNLIINGVNTELYQPARKQASILGEWSVDESNFVVAYTGLHGLIHGLDFVIEVAHQLRNEDKILFVFIGDGVRKDSLMTKAKEFKLKNIIFMDAKQENELACYVQNCDAGLATTKSIELCKGTIPVKMFTYMACSKPVLLCVDGEARSIVEQSSSGIYIEPENAEQLKLAILKLKANRKLCKSMGQKGRQLVEQHYSRAALAQKLEQCLLDSIGEN